MIFEIGLKKFEGSFNEIQSDIIEHLCPCFFGSKCLSHTDKNCSCMGDGFLGEYNFYNADDADKEDMYNFFNAANQIKFKVEKLNKNDCKVNLMPWALGISVIKDNGEIITNFMTIDELSDFIMTIYKIKFS